MSRETRVGSGGPPQGEPLWRRYVIAAAVLVAAIFAWAQPAAAAPPAGFQETTAFSGLINPTAISFASNGRIFVGEKGGRIKVYDNLTDTTATIAADLRTDVYNFWDRGLLGMTLDPQYPTDPYLYVLYTRDAVPGGDSPRWGTAAAEGDPCPNPPGATDDGCLVTGRLARLTLDTSGVMTGSPTNLITDWCQQFPSHSTGDLAFGADGFLYLSGGDGASFNYADYGQGGDNDNNDGSPRNPCADPPGTVGSFLTSPTAEGGALRSQDVLSPATPSDPTTLDGSVLRVDPDTDTGPGVSGNPFFGSTDANERRIIAFGHRNPFRLTIRPGTNEVWTGDVGWSTWEEINRVVDPGGTAENFGWPCYEGDNSGSVRQVGYDTNNLDLCEDLYAEGTGAATAPYYAYNHNAKVVTGESCPTGSSAIAGLAFYQSGPFPNAYNGALFFADNTRDCIWAMFPGSDGLPNKANIQTFNPGAANPVDLEISPQGELFYADFDGGTIRRIVHTTGNAPPNAVATATPSNGNAPLTTTLSAASSTDPNGDSLSYAWDLDGDGQFGDDNRVSFQHTYTETGTFTPGVLVTDPDGVSDTDSVQVQVNNTPPSAQINAPTSSVTWGVGDLVQLTGSATDAQQTLPDSAFDWRIVINHCPSNCHQHTMETIADKRSATFNAPDHEYPSTLTIELTVTDAGGLTDTESVTIDPRTVQLTLNSTPTGLQLGLFSDQSTAPYTRTVIEDSVNSVSAPSPQTLGGQQYQFQSWSDGGAASHNVTASTSQTLTATYTEVSTTPGLLPPVFGDGDIRGIAKAGKKCKKGKKGKKKAVAAKKCKKKAKR